jgi:hypothetical protein
MRGARVAGLTRLAPIRREIKHGMIRKNGYRFSDRIMLKKYLDHAERALENKEIKG